MLKRGLTLVLLFFITLTLSAPWATSQQEGEVPAYNAGPPAKGTKLPPILGKEQLWGENAQYPYQATPSRQPQNRHWCIHQRRRERRAMNVCAARCVTASASTRPKLRSIPPRRKSCHPRSQ